MHVLFHLIFAVGLLWFLSRELGFKFAPKKHLKWLVYGVVAGVIASLVSYFYFNKIGNFVLHSVGGGVVTALTYQYLRLHAKLKFKWYVDLIILFGFVSSLGVLNELYEYAIELMNIMVSSWDTHDTWRDIVANTTGAFTAWAIIKIFTKNHK